jgi:LCP family protein required for cell wall assembly
VSGKHPRRHLARRNQTGRRPGRRGLALVIRTAAGLTSLAALVTSGWAWATWTNFQGNITRVTAIAPHQPGPTAKKSADGGAAQNILIVGNDDRDTATDAELKDLGTTRDGGSLNTDTMMVMHLPAGGAKATVFAIPRDSYVDIPGHGMNKINAAYALGVSDGHGDKAAGARLAVQVVQNLTGLTIDHFVQVDLIGFYRISLAIGGIQVNMCRAVKEPNSGIDLPAGPSTIEGKQALAFVRQRYDFPDGLGDLDRIKRQQYFLSAVFRKISSAGVLLNPIKLHNLLNAVSASLTMDQTLDPLTLAEQMQDLTASNLTFTTIPWDGFDNTTPVGAVVLVNPTEVHARVTQLLDPNPPPTGTQPAGPATPPAAASHTPTAAPAQPSPTPSDLTNAQQAATGCIN